MKEWRCIVCGKRFKNGEKPAACPLCGVLGDFIVGEEDYERPSGVMSKTSRSSFDEAMELEITATRVYHEAAEKAKKEGDEVTRVFFAALARNEFGHQKAIKYQIACRPDVDQDREPV